MRHTKQITLLVVAVLLFAAVSTTNASGVTVPGNYTCPADMFEFKVDPPVSGTYNLDGVNTVTVTFTGLFLDWSSTISMDTVAVKGGPNSNLYSYNPESFGDTGLHAPLNPKNGKYYGISHVTFCYDYELAVSKTAQTSYVRTFLWDISKSVDPSVLDLFVGDTAGAGYTVAVTKTGFVDSDWMVTGNISIHNPAPIAATITGVSDTVSGYGPVTVSCPVSFPYQLAAGSDLVCTYQSSLPDGSTRTNTATVTTSGPVKGGTASAAVMFGDPTTVVNGSITVVDTNGPSWNFSDTGSVSYQVNFTCNQDEGSHHNTATIQETGQSASADVTVNCYTPGISKDAAASWMRDFTWDIFKSVDNPFFDLENGQSGTATYTVSVHRFVNDHGYAVSGNIYVTNPHPSQALNVTVSDTISGGISPTLSCGGALSVPPAGSASCSYSADLPDASPRTNTATITMANGTQFSASVDFSFGEPTISGPATINVVDSYAGALGSASGDQVFNYSRTFTCGQDAGSHPNTATIVETGQSASANVDVVCHEPPPTAEWCSPGYWKNHLESWPVSPDTSYNDVIDPDIDGNPSLLDVVSNPDVYGGEATNKVADYLSAAAGLNFTGERIDNCPLN